MNTHIEALERLATRGTPRGSDALIGEVAESLSTDRPKASLQPRPTRRRLPGPVWGVAVAAVVLMVGLGTRWLAGPFDEASPSGTVWQRVATEGFMRSVLAGPGGFVADGFGGLWSSEDGESWTQSEIPGAGNIFVESVAATDDRWLVTADADGGGAWWSDDGRSWTRVEWPSAIAGTVQQVMATPEFFFVVARDVFAEGTTLWRSDDAQTWNEIPAGPVTGTSGFLSGTDGGLVLRDEADISVSADGGSWSTATIEMPPELGNGLARITAVDHVGDTWIAVVEVERIGEDPVLAVFTSAEGERWDFRGVPPFGQVEGLAPGVTTAGMMGDRLALSPTVTPTSTQEDGRIVANGVVESSGQIWSTADGVDWVLELTTDQDILGFAGTDVDGRLHGVWIGLPAEEPAAGTPDEAPPVVTTMVMPDEPVDAEGLEFQQAIVEDGEVTYEEFENALEHWKTCMEEHGVTDVHYTIDRAGGWSGEYASPSPNGDVEGAISNLCYESWVSQVESQLSGG